MYLLCPPRLSFGVGGDPLGSSFVATLELGLRNGAHWGSEIAWTYGPLGALDFNLGLAGSMLTLSTAAHLLVAALTVGLIATILWSCQATAWLWSGSLLLLVTASAAGPVELSTECLLSGAMCAWLATARNPALGRRWRLAAAITCGAILAVGTLDKISVAAGAVGVLTVVAGATLLQRDGRRLAATAGASWLASLAGLWLLAGQRFADVPPFLSSAWELTAGYANAMGSRSENTTVVFGVLVLIAAMTATIGALRRQQLAAALLVSLAALLALLLFKEGFVRSDAIHDAWFFVPAAYLVVLLAAAAHSVGGRARLLSAAAGAAAVAVVGGLVVPPSMLTSWSLHDRLTGFRNSLAILASPSFRDQVRRQDIAEFAALYAIPPSILDHVRGTRVAVLPYFNAAATVYGFAPAQPPVVQMYAGYSTPLDAKDAAFFGSPSAPEFVLLAYLPIDGRLEQFDEPLVMRTFVERYEVDPSSSTALLVLRKRGSITPFNSHPVGSPVCAPLGQSIPVPQRAGEFVYAHVAVSQSALGRAKAVLYKASRLHVSLATPQPWSRPPADIPLMAGTAADGLLVSGLATDSASLGRLLSGQAAQPILSLSISADSAPDYSSPVCVQFESAAPPR